jgi:uncharacterized membrane protein
MRASTDIIHHAVINNYHIEEVGTIISYYISNPNNHHPITHGAQVVGGLLARIEA